MCSCCSFDPIDKREDFTISQILLIYIFLGFLVCVCKCPCKYRTHKAQKETSKPLELELWVVASHLIWVLVIELGVSRKEMCALNL